MDRENNKKSIQEINIDKVVKTIGLPEKNKYDSIDIYLDADNQDNLWAIVHYSIYRRKRRISQEKVFKFNKYNEMLEFLKNNFDTYELTHQVDYLNRRIFFHKVDYICMNYYLYDGKPDLNYIEIEYKEYVNDGFHICKKKLPKEYEKMFIDIIKINKKLALTDKLDFNTYKEIDVNAKEEKFIDEEGKERISRKERRLEKVKNQLPSKPKKSYKVRNLIIYASVVAVLTGGGITLKRNSEYKKEVITNENSELKLLDYDIVRDKDKALTIINDLMVNNYQDVSLSDLDFFFDYVKKVSTSNYDGNKSSAYFNYKEYFDSIIWENSKESAKIVVKCSEVLNNIEEKYRDCFKIIDNKLIIKEESVKVYLDYVASLTFMYDTIVDQRNSGQVQIKNKYISSIYASKEEIEAYNSFPKVLKYIILSQLRDMIYHSNYKVTQTPSNYYGGTDKYDLLNKIEEKLEIIETTMKDEILISSKKTV